jgi:hypothetical protein
MGFASFFGELGGGPDLILLIESHLHNYDIFMSNLVCNLQGIVFPKD